MREIKFRGLYKGTMVHGNLIIGVDSYENPICQIERTDAHDFAQYDVDKNTVGQFTGLKDKAGVEIYEGDIVKTSR